jgi:hypothetical protein
MDDALVGAGSLVANRYFLDTGRWVTSNRYLCRLRVGGDSSSMHFCRSCESTLFSYIGVRSNNSNTRAFRGY